MANSSKLTASFKIKRLRTIYILYWFLLVYIVAALVWWFIALNQQNSMMTILKLQELNPHEEGYQKKSDKINEDKQRKTAQYIGEGATFFLLIVAGAVVSGAKVVGVGTGACATIGAGSGAGVVVVVTEDKEIAGLPVHRGKDAQRGGDSGPGARDRDSTDAGEAQAV